jgi:MFS family permease
MSALCGAAGEITFLGLDGMNQLIAFRALQGICGGNDDGVNFCHHRRHLFSAERGRYQGVFSGAWGICICIWSNARRLAYDQISWARHVYVNLPVGLIALVALYLYFPYWHPRNVKRHIDWAGSQR